MLAVWRRRVIGLAVIIVAGFGLIAVTAPPAMAATGCTLHKSGFLGFPNWWEFLNGSTIGHGCSPVVDWPSGVWKIGLALADILLHVAGIAAVISILVSSTMYVTSAGSPERSKAALDRIIASLVGLAIALVAAATVKFVGSKLVGSAATPNSYYNLPVTHPESTLKTGLSIFFGLLGVIAFLMMVIGGFNFVLSQGNPEKTSRSRNTLIYAAVGLAIAASGALIVSVVLNKST